jgi:hypothetical protein
MTITISAADAAALAAGKSVAMQTAVVPPPPPPPPPPPGSSVVYADGKLNWPGSYSWGLVAVYNDTTGAPASGAQCMRCDLTGSFGGWLPYALNWDFKTTGFNFLEFDLKASVSNQTWDIYGVKVGDVNYGLPECRVIDHGPTPGQSPPANVWQHYKVPLTLIMNDHDLYKFAIQDKTGLTTNHWWGNNVAFTA